jgi:AraC-like DNA-binding protein
MPDGCADFVWDGSAVLLVGARVDAGRFPVSAEGRNVGLRLRPGVAGAVAGAGASSLGAGPVPLASLWGDRVVRRLESALAGAGGAGGASGQHRMLEQAVTDRLEGAGRGPDPAVVSAARLLRRPGATVDGVAAEVGLSGRELRRRFPDHVGYGPKALHRVLRFQRFLGLAPDVVLGAASLASAAAEAGYADQSHLGRDCRRLSGSSPAALVGRWACAAGSGRNLLDQG